MKQILQTCTAFLLITFCAQAFAQEGHVKTIFKGSLRSSSGYAALTNKFTTIRGDYANLAGFYGGWYVNHRMLIGIGAAASTNDIRVPQQFSTNPTQTLSYEYGQFGLVTEYVVNSDKPVHFVFHLFGGPGFTLQYQRHGWDHNNHDEVNDENWFVVVEPALQLEINLFKWMRLSPGVSYRASFGSDGRGMNDSDVRGISYNATIKLGKF